MADNADSTESDRMTPMRGALELTVSASSPQTMAGSDFSIFVVIRNPFNVPLTLHQVQTHIPVELVDMNRARIESAAVPDARGGSIRRFLETLFGWLPQRTRRTTTGVAIAVGTEATAEEVRNLFTANVHVEGRVGEGSTVAGVALNFPAKPSPAELDRIFGRLIEYQRGVVPVLLQPGDSVVRQFVLRTANWVFFTPLVHTFQIQVNYAVDDLEHTATVPYELNIRATLRAVVIGAAVGAVVGALLKSLSVPAGPESDLPATIRALTVGILASTAVVIALGRRQSAQPFISIEDFWGGLIVGFSVAFFGFDQFSSLFARSSG